jgi:hypothetical protein
MEQLIIRLQTMDDFAEPLPSNVWADAFNDPQMTVADIMNAYQTAAAQHPPCYTDMDTTPKLSIQSIPKTAIEKTNDWLQQINMPDRIAIPDLQLVAQLKLGSRIGTNTSYKIAYAILERSPQLFTTFPTAVADIFTGYAMLADNRQLTDDDISPRLANRIRNTHPYTPKLQQAIFLLSPSGFNIDHTMIVALRHRELPAECGMPASGGAQIIRWIAANITKYPTILFLIASQRFIDILRASDGICAIQAIAILQKLADPYTEGWALVDLHKIAEVTALLATGGERETVYDLLDRISEKCPRDINWQPVYNRLLTQAQF